jgi:acetolactate synthase-1/2/3 large subunit
MNGATLLVRTLQAAGVKHLFSLSGNHIMPVYDALIGAGIGLIHTRHEAAAVHMADAWARITGTPGIALVTGGPGHANALSALYTAAMAEAPVVLLSGHAPLAQLGRGSFQEMAQAELALPLTKASWVCRDAAAIGADLARALVVAASGRPGPVHLSLPVDLLQAQVGEAAIPAAGAFEPVPVPPTAAQVQEALQRLQRARRPVLLTGPQLLSRAGRERLAAFERASGVPTVGMQSPRGIADPALGAFAQTLREADCVLLLAKRVDFTLGFGAALNEPCEVMQFDADERELDRAAAALGVRLVQRVLADAPRTLAALSASVEAAAPLRRADTAWLEAVRSAIDWRPEAWRGLQEPPAQPQEQHPRQDGACLHPLQACRPFQALLDAHPQAVLVSDGGEFGQWAQACLSAPHVVINGVAGAIGAALPFAIAARLAVGAEAPVIAFSGDGSFGFHPAEVETALRHRLPFVAVVGNDARWNAEHQIQLREYGSARTFGLDLLPVRYDRVCAAFGGHGEHVADTAEMPAAARRALQSALPACIDAAISSHGAPLIRRHG